jgi:hypothetical protein
MYLAYIYGKKIKGEKFIRYVLNIYTVEEI